MQNEQCGLCWDLKFDKQGNKTHELNHRHDFIPLDYCEKCQEPKYDQYGLPTHPYNVHNFQEAQRMGLSHKFNSILEAKTKAKRRKHRTILAFIGVISMGVATGYNFPNLLI